MSARHSRIGRIAARSLLAPVAAALVMGAMPAMAQDSSADARVRRLEAEVRSLQRKVFPGGNAQTFQPEITPSPATTAAAGAATTSAVTDLLTRMDAIEGQMARLTSQTELNTNRIAQLEARIGAGTTPPSTGTIPGTGTNIGAGTGAGTGPNAGTVPATTPPADTPPSAPTGPSASRVEAVRAVQRPQSADAGDDEYSYGFRLYDAKFYPEAEQQLRLYLQKYPRHPRVSHARNLLGRAYLDDGDPREAAKWFLQNYQTDKTGARAPDSLLNLARSMKRLNDTKRACVALGEFGASYAAEAAGRLKGDYDDTRKGLTCG